MGGEGEEEEREGERVSQRKEKMETHKEKSQLLHAQPTDSLPSALIQRPLDKFAFLLLQRNDAILDRIRHEDAMHLHGSALTDAMRAIDGLFLNIRIPKRIEDDDLRGGGEVEAGIPGFERDEHDAVVGFGAEVDDGFVAGVGGHGAVEAGVGEGFPVDGDFEQVEEGGELAEDDCFFAFVAGFDGAEEGEYLFDFGRGDVVFFQAAEIFLAGFDALFTERFELR